MPQSPKARAREIVNRTAHDRATLKGTPQAVAALLGELRRNTARIRASTDLTAGAKTRLLREAREAATARLDLLVEEAEEARSSVEAEADAALARADTDDPTQLLLRELQLQRAWARTERLLKSGATVPDVVARAAQAKDAATFDALRAEVDGWLLERGAAASEIESTHALISHHEDVVLPADKLAAKLARKDAEGHTYFLKMAIGQAREELTGGPQWSQLPAGPDETLALDEPSPV